jgi:predicted transcriptional regulator YdeE
MNIFTHMIADMLDVTLDVALRVHEHIDNWFNLDWSEASEEEIKFTAMAAFEDLNETVPANF